MAKNLLIVESPAKAKTIEEYLGKDFLVKSSYGHIRDLSKGDKAVDVTNNFAQQYEIPADKKALVNELKKLAKDAETVWLASDEDREGEAIAWHLFETLGLKEANTRRIVFHEITKPAILKAIETPRKIDYDLVNAQQARRVLDRLVGFELSPVLWKKVKPSLSAGRVQSVAVRLIVDREREINKFNTKSAFRVIAVFHTGNPKETFKAELPQRFASAEEANKFLTDCTGADFTINNLETRPTKRSPAAPFTTSTLQQEASRKLGFSVSRTMMVAQKLYETGKITYMRTDSVNLSDMALGAAKSEINKAYGEKYHQFRKFKTKLAGAQEAHEAIRPTHFEWHNVDGDPAEKRLYDLIWKRAIASQMTEAAFEKTTAKIGISSRKEELLANGEVMKFDGFLKVYLESHDEETDAHLDDEKDNPILPPLQTNQKLFLINLSATQRFTRPASRYTEASLVKQLEELGIGRPSTYAPTISTIQNRGYVVKEDREGKQRSYQKLTLKDGKISTENLSEIAGTEKSKLFPTDIGAVVNDFLVQYFKDIVDYHFTASVEKEFDEIAQGLKDWTKMIHSFYKPFHQEVQTTIETADRATGERDLGTDPVSGKKVSVRIGRFGPFVQLGEASEEEKPKYASLRAGQMIETIALDEAMELFKLPRLAGQFEGQDMQVNIGRFGPYILHDKKFYSLPKDLDPFDVNAENGAEIILAKRKKDAERVIRVFDENAEAKIVNGRWGPYIEFGKQNVKIPKNTEHSQLSYNEVLKLAEAAPEPKKGGRFAKKTEAKKTPAKKATVKKTSAKTAKAKTTKAKTK